MTTKVLKPPYNPRYVQRKKLLSMQLYAEIILILIVMARNSSYLLMKLGIGNIAPVSLIAFRFLSAFIICALLFPKKVFAINKKTLLAGLSIGVLMFFILFLQITGLKDVSSSEAGFLASTTVVFVPVIQAVHTKSLPKATQCLYILITMTGIALLTITSGLSISWGAVLYIIGAFIYAVHILMTESFSKDVDLFSIGIIELFVTGILSLFTSLLIEDFAIPSQPADWAIILSLAILCSIVGLAIQPKFQQYTTAERYGLFCGLGPLFSCLLGVMFLHEKFGVREAVGSFLILAGILLATFYEKKEKSC